MSKILWDNISGVAGTARDIGDVPTYLHRLTKWRSFFNPDFSPKILCNKKLPSNPGKGWREQVKARHIVKMIKDGEVSDIHTSCVPYLGRQRPHPAGCHLRWCESPWQHRLHQAAPRHCWHWRCCCNCSWSILCDTAAPTPFSNAPVPWMIKKGRKKKREEGGDIRTMFVSMEPTVCGE